MLKNSKDETLVELNEVMIGKRKLRYIYIPLSVIQKQDGDYNHEYSESHKCSVEISPIDESPFCLLFLGGDILSDTVISTKNMARQHLKFSKHNSCCRVTFPYRLAGVAGHTKVAWFYDIHGILKAAFEFYEKKEQILVMQYFFTLWSTTKNVTLPIDLKLTEDEVIAKKLIISILVSEIDNCVICEKNKLVVKQNKIEQSTQCYVETESFSSQTRTVTFNDSSTQTSMKYSGCAPLKQNLSMDIDTKIDDNETVTSKNEFESGAGNTNQTDDINLSDGATYSPFKDDNSTNSTTRMSLVLISTLLANLQEFFQQASSDIIFYKIYSLLEIVLTLLQEEVTHIEKSNTGIFPFHLLVEYYNMRKIHTKKHKNISTEMFYQECVLGVISKWLASQFHDFRTVISSQVEKFKQQQMHQNKTILNPVELLLQHNLFPSYMIEFLSEWIGGFETDNEKLFICSRILLALELLNDSLITGMGHVVYAKLKCNYSM